MSSLQKRCRVFRQSVDLLLSCATLPEDVKPRCQAKKPRAVAPLQPRALEPIGAGTARSPSETPLETAALPACKTYAPCSCFTRNYNRATKLDALCPPRNTNLTVLIKRINPGSSKCNGTHGGKDGTQTCGAATASSCRPSCGHRHHCPEHLQGGLCWCLLLRLSPPCQCRCPQLQVCCDCCWSLGQNLLLSHGHHQNGRLRGLLEGSGYLWEVCWCKPHLL